LSLPAIVAGPMLRHCQHDQVHFWLVTTKPYNFTIELYHFDSQSLFYQADIPADDIVQTQVGEQAFINNLCLRLPSSLTENELYGYQVKLTLDDEDLLLTEQIPGICYEQESWPTFAYKPDINQLMHGSCRKPHFDGDDALAQIDTVLSKQSFTAEKRPSLLMMSGDQIYADDVAGPMLNAIHQVIALLGLFDEQWQNDATDIDIITHSLQLFEHSECYYGRHLILPHDRVNKTYLDRIIGATKRPIFTSVNAKNHLVTLSEVLAMYFLVWSETLWAFVDLAKIDQVGAVHHKTYQQERDIIERFVEQLPAVKRAFAHIPVYMIFDDHDITDDWNLTRGWEEAAYEHPFSKRILGNALAGYYLCQGLGNGLDRLEDLNELQAKCFTDSGVIEHDEFINALFDWDNWHYSLATTPKMVVLDTRTQRWRSESNAGKPSGLMDWESLSEMQQELINEPSVILVSAAPIYGVKLIEAVQRIVTFFGKPLAVDAENWMAHSGTANVMLNIFRHHKTPPNFIILSGDVHYSFFYDVSHRFIRNSSRIYQITCSGFKNQFPVGLLRVMERLNHYLYGQYSPLNWFTKRRRMRIRVRHPEGQGNTSLYNGSGVGLVDIADNAESVQASLMTEKGHIVHFSSRYIDEQEDND